MGKGARTRERTAEEKKIYLQQLEVEKKKKKRGKIAAGIVALVLVVAIAISSCVYIFYYSNGKYLRDTVVATSESTSVDNAMMLYFFTQSFNTYKNYYGEYFSSLTGVDETKSLKTQMTSTEGVSWFDNLLDTTKTALTELMVLNDEAIKSGLTITDTEKEVIHERAQAVVDPTIYGKNINHDDIERALTLSFLGAKYQMQLRDGYEVTDADIDSYYEENSKTYETVSYRSYNITYNDDTAASSEESSEESSDTADEKKTFTSEEAKYYSVQFEGTDVMTEDDYLAKITEIIKTQEPSITDEDLESDLNTTLSTNVAYTADDVLSEWFFDEAREVGNIYVYNDTANKRYTVYYLASLPERNDAATVDMRHILVTTDTYGTDEETKAKAEEILADFQNGDKSEESFAELALRYTEDSGSQFTGGLYENVKNGDMVTTINDWLFDSSRKSGDVEIVVSTYGYHVVYYVSEGMPEWKGAVDTDIRSNKYTEEYTALQESDPVTFNEDKLQDLPV